MFCLRIDGIFLKIVRGLALFAFLVIPVLVHASNENKLSIISLYGEAQAIFQTTLDTAADHIRKGNFITGLSLATIDTLANGLTSDNVNYLRRITNLFAAQRILFIQKYEMCFPLEAQSAEFKLFLPL